MLNLNKKTEESKRKVVFLDDFNRLLDLSKGDSLAEASYEFLIKRLKAPDLYNDNHQSSFIVIFWNRFTGEFKELHNVHKGTQLEDMPHNSKDLISWFPIYATNLHNFKSLSAVLKIVETKWATATVEELESHKNEVISFLKSKIQTKLTRDQKELLSSKSSNNWSFFFNKSDRGELYPIDVYPEDVQFKEFWSHTELFKDEGRSLISPKFNVKGVSYWSSVFDLIVDFDKGNKTASLQEPYDKLSDYLIELSIKKLNDSKTSIKVQEKLLLFLEQFKGDDSIKIKDKFDILEENIDNFVNELEFHLYKFKKGFGSEGSVLLSNPSSFIGEQFIGEDEKNKAKKILVQKVLNLLKKNSSKPALYYEYLNNFLFNSFVNDSKNENYFIVESFSSAKDLNNSLFMMDRTIVYSPFYRHVESLDTILSGDSLVKEINEIENSLKTNKSKTTKFLKTEIELILNSNLVLFSEVFKNHLKFVLNMDTID